MQNGSGFDEFSYSHWREKFKFGFWNKIFMYICVNLMTQSAMSMMKYFKEFKNTEHKMNFVLHTQFSRLRQIKFTFSCSHMYIIWTNAKHRLHLFWDQNCMKFKKSSFIWNEILSSFEYVYREIGLNKLGCFVLTKK